MLGLVLDHRKMISASLLIIVLLGGQSLAGQVSALYEYDELSSNPLVQGIPVRLESGLLNFENLVYSPGTVRVMVSGKGDPSSIADDVHVSYHLKTRDGFIAFGATTEDKLPRLAAQGLTVSRDPMLEFDEVRDASRFGEILGSDKVHKETGLTGKGINVAVVDTGVDFANKDLKSALARDSKGRPIMLDTDGQGIVLTRTKFVAKLTPQGHLLNSTAPKDDKDEFVSNVYMKKDGIFLNLNKGANGTKFEVYNSIYPLLSPLVLNATANKDWKIGRSNTDYIRSMSGEYHMGFVMQIQFHLGRAGLIIIPVLVVDSKEVGVYDTVIADMSSSWADFKKFELRTGSADAEFDFDFTDETQIRLGEGKESLIFDDKDDGTVDLSAGMVGAHVLDVWGATRNDSKALIDDYLGAVNGTLLQPLDTGGTYFGVMFDFLGHGTGSAASVASRGDDVYRVYQNETEFKLRGVATSAKIIPIKSLWYGDVVYGWFWAAGFEQGADGNWTYTGEHRADIMNNSWGVSNIPVLDYGPGYDLLSILMSLLTVPGSLDPEFPGVLMVASAGNTGFGYGTLGSPGSSPFGLTVGATTNNVFVGSGFTKKEPRFGNSTVFYDDVAEFSSRGPNLFGEVKPDVMSTGAYGFVPQPPNVKHAPNATGAFGLFGGTSMASPLAAGGAAVVMQGLKQQKLESDPFWVKTVLMSTAVDLGSDPLTQGAGKVYIANAVDYIEEKNGSFIVYTEDTYPNIAGLFNETMQSYDITGFGNYTLAFPERTLPSSKWFAGFVNRGDSAETRFTVLNPSNATLDVKVEPTMLELIKQQSFNGTTEMRLKDPFLNDTESGFIPNYIKLNEIFEIPEDTEMMTIKAYFPFESFLNTTESVYANSLNIASLYFYDWNDADGDDKVSYNETSLVNRGGAWGTIQHLTVRDPLHRLSNTPLLGVYPVPTVFSYWSGNTNQNTTSMNYTLVASFYKKSGWDMVTVGNDMLQASPHGKGVFNARIEVPEDAMPGIYQGFITLKSSSQVSNVPVSFVVPMTITAKDTPIVIAGEPSSDLLYDNAGISGAFDMLSRYNAGQWRYYYLNVTDPTVNAMSLKVSWRNNWTSTNAMVANPDGRIIASSVPAGVFKVFLGWASNDWLGSTRFSEGGGFYPSANSGNNSTVLYVPINSTGIYAIMLHNTLFHGLDLTEPIVIEAKLTTLLPDTKPPEISVEFPEYARGVAMVPVLIDDENIEDASFSVDGSAPISLKENATMVIDTTSLTEGFHHIIISATDTVGHRVFKNVIFTADNTEPQLTVRSPADGIVVADQFDVSLEVSDSSLRSFSVTLPNGTVVENARNFTVDTSSVQDGEYPLLIRAEDGPGNVAEVSRTIRIDNAVPQIEILNPRDGTTVSGKLDVKYSVSDANLKDVVLTVGEKSIDINNTGSYALDTTTLFDGEYNLELTASDMAGNTNSKAVGIVAVNYGPTLLTAQLLGIAIGVAIGAGATVAILVPTLRRRRAQRQEGL